jgi:hypothetical protein
MMNLQGLMALEDSDEDLNESEMNTSRQMMDERDVEKGVYVDRIIKINSSIES